MPITEGPLAIPYPISSPGWSPPARSRAPDPAAIEAEIAAKRQEIVERGVGSFDPEAARQRLADAEAALTDALARYVAAKRALEPLREAKRRLDDVKAEAAAAVSNVRASLSQLDAKERDALEQWAATAVGDQPLPLAAERHELQQQLDEAQRRLDQIAETWQRQRDALAAAEARTAPYGRLIDNATVELGFAMAEVKGHEYQEKLERLAEVYCDLLGLNMYLRGFKGSVDADLLLRPVMGAVAAPQIAHFREGEHKLQVPGFWLHCHPTSGELAATVSFADIERAAVAWAQRFAQVREDGAEKERERALGAENAELRAQCAKLEKQRRRKQRRKR